MMLLAVCMLASRGAACTVDRLCFACASAPNVTAMLNSHIFFSACCTKYCKPIEDGHMMLTIPPGVRNVTIHGPGRIQSATGWPLRPGPNFIMADCILQSNTQREVAVAIAESGYLNITNVTAPDFVTAVAVSSPTGAQITLAAGSQITGSSNDALAAFGHVQGAVTVDCHKPSTVVVQEMGTDTFDMKLKNTCTTVNLTALLRLYGAAYESQLFSTPSPRPPPWRAVRIAATFAVATTFALLFGFQPQLTRALAT